MSFIATANPPAVEPDLRIENDPWWPPIDLAALRAACRLDGTVTPARLRESALAALASVNAELSAWRVACEAGGADKLSAVPAHQINGESVKCHQYRRAVYCAVQADLAEAYREIAATPTANGRVTDQLALKTDEHRRNLRWAISDLMDIRRTVIDLI